MVRHYKIASKLNTYRDEIGVDALNTTLEVLLFAAAMNLGQGWKTVATLFACKPSRASSKD